jgi:hypothetical protein
MTSSCAQPGTRAATRPVQVEATASALTEGHDIGEAK